MVNAPSQGLKIRCKVRFLNSQFRVFYHPRLRSGGRWPYLLREGGWGLREKSALSLE